MEWERTPLGPLGSWSLSLQSAVAMCLQSRFQMAIYWGFDLNCIYNDAESQILGNCTPARLVCRRVTCSVIRGRWSVLN